MDKWQKEAESLPPVDVEVDIMFSGSIITSSVQHSEEYGMVWTIDLTGRVRPKYWKEK